MSTEPHAPPSVSAWCPAGHYLGASINLVTGRDIYCPRCGRWYVWRELETVRKKKEILN